MIKYSTNPSANAKAITNSPTAPIKTKGGQAQEADALDLDAEDANDN
jgi:hypothetical protein